MAALHAVCRLSDWCVEFSLLHGGASARTVHAALPKSLLLTQTQALAVSLCIRVSNFSLELSDDFT